jgi:hypothetical protein
LNSITGGLVFTAEIPAAVAAVAAAAAVAADAVDAAVAAAAAAAEAASPSLRPCKIRKPAQAFLGAEGK